MAWMAPYPSIMPIGTGVPPPTESGVLLPEDSLRVKESDAPEVAAAAVAFEPPL